MSRARGRTKLPVSLSQSVLIRLVISHVVPASEAGVGDKWVSSSHETQERERSREGGEIMRKGKIKAQSLLPEDQSTLVMCRCLRYSTLSFSVWCAILVTVLHSTHYRNKTV